LQAAWPVAGLGRDFKRGYTSEAGRNRRFPQVGSECLPASARTATFAKDWLGTDRHGIRAGLPLPGFLKSVPWLRPLPPIPLVVPQVSRVLAEKSSLLLSFHSPGKKAREHPTPSLLPAVPTTTVPPGFVHRDGIPIVGQAFYSSGHWKRFSQRPVRRSLLRPPSATIGFPANSPRADDPRPPSPAAPEETCKRRLLPFSARFTSLGNRGNRVTVLDQSAPRLPRRHLSEPS